MYPGVHQPQAQAPPPVSQVTNEQVRLKVIRYARPINLKSFGKCRKGIPLYQTVILAAKLVL